MTEFVTSPPSNYGSFGSISNSEIIQDTQDDYSEDAVGRGLAALRERIQSAQLRGFTGSAASPINIDNELEAELKFERDLKEVIDLTDDEPRELNHAAEPINVGEHSLEHYTFGKFRFRKGMFVELKNPLPVRYDPRFVKITDILLTREGKVLIRGSPYTRTGHGALGGKLPRKLNEVCCIQIIDNSDARSGTSTVDLEPSQIIRIRELRTTNAPFPLHRFDRADEKMGRDWVEIHGPLVCRYVYVEYFANSKKTAKPREWAIIRISEEEADPKFRVSDETVLVNWRGEKVRGGSFLPNGPKLDIIDLDSDLDDTRPTTGSEQEVVKVAPGQRYSAGDTFSGAGGASRGMHQAGARIEFTIDHWSHAVASIKRNFPEACNYEMEITDFIKSKTIRHRVDLLHLSPPCQVWSPAHTVAGRNDDMNLAALFACPNLIEKLRPRVFTLEQTFGILHDRFSEYFNSLINGFTSYGYSVRWKAINLATYGLPQRRKRLIILGAGPGEKLPNFPAPTHSENGVGGLRSFVNAYDATAAAREPRQRHNPLNTRKSLKHPLASWDPYQPLPRTITCSGGQNYHWHGRRDLTLLELALLQGFPADHKFNDKCVKKQIGNAFPSSVVKLIYSHLISHLDKTDKVDRPGDQTASVPTGTVPDNPIILISDEDDDLEITHVGRKPPRRFNFIQSLCSSDESDTDDTPTAPLNVHRKRSRGASSLLSPPESRKKQIVALDDDSDSSPVQVAGPVTPSKSPRSRTDSTVPPTASPYHSVRRWFWTPQPLRSPSAAGACEGVIAQDGDDEQEGLFSEMESMTIDGSRSPRTPPMQYRLRTPWSESNSAETGKVIVDLSGENDPENK